MLKQVQHDKVCAFTLAEVLITLGIIGIVAAMTIPTLMQKTNERETVSKLKKINYVMSNAYKNYIAINGKPEFMSRDENGGAASEYVYQIFAPYLKIVSDYGLVDSNANCVPNVVYKYKKGTDYSNLTTKDIYYKVLLADGSSLMFVASNNAEYTSQKRLAAFNVDTNGKKGPNKLRLLTPLNVQDVRPCSGTAYWQASTRWGRLSHRRRRGKSYSTS